MIKKLDWYIIKKFLGTFFFAIIILAVISCVIDYSEKIDDFVKHKAPFLEILNYFKNFMPYIISLLYPLFIFIAAIFFTSKLAYKSEIIAMLAGGVSFQRFLRPYVIGAAFLGFIALLASHFIVPMANKQRLTFEDKYVHERVSNADQNVHIRLSPTLYVYMQNYDYTSNMGYRFTAETVDGTLLKEKIMADRASYDSVKKIWNLYGVSIRENDSLKEKLEYKPEITRKYGFVPKDLKINEDAMTGMTTPQLLKHIALMKTRGAETLNFYYVELHKRTAQAFAGFILTIIGACISSRKIRGGSGFHLALGIVISAVYIMLLQFSTTFSTKAGLNAFIAVWIPNVIFTGLAYYLYRRQIK
ncbi:LptF/LptG family permease [Chitinophagaceae bacterium MMS25-I14]